MVIPAKRFWIALAVGIPITAVATLAGMDYFIWVYNGLLVLAVLLDYRLAPQRDDILIKRTFEPVFSVRVGNAVKVEIENDANLPITMRIRDEADATFATVGNEVTMRLEPRQISSFSYRTTPPERGDFAFRGTFLRLLCPLGLAMKQIKMETGQSVRVYPNLLALNEFAFLDQRGRLRELGVRRLRMKGLGSDFESLREYELGDDFRKIDWNATARRGKLIVKQFEVERNQSVVIVLDCARHMLGEIDSITKLDSSLDACLMLSKAAFSKGDQVGLLVFGDKVHQYVPPRKGKGQIGALIEAVHNLEAVPVEPDYVAAFSLLGRRCKRRSFVVVFTDVFDPERSQKLITALSPIRRNHLVLIVQIHDPKVRELANAKCETVDDMYRKAAGLWMDEDWGKAAAALKLGHIQVLESEPTTLSTDLISYYFDVKDRALL